MTAQWPVVYKRKFDIVLLDVGKELFKKGKLKRKNSGKVISKNNLVLVDYLEGQRNFHLYHSW